MNRTDYVRLCILFVTTSYYEDVTNCPLKMNYKLCWRILTPRYPRVFHLPGSGRSTVETPPAYPPPLPSSQITSSVSTTYAVQSNHLQCIHHHGPSLLELIHHHFAVARGMCIFPWSFLSARNSSVSLHGVGGVLVVGLSMHQPLTFCYWLMDEVCCEAFLGNANRTVAVHVLCLLLTLVMR